ncbi:MAG: hypothetical protein KDC46_14405, partial [Thermoleophilia bacterium]|nr:hypothetical protein [Thermoleophilia bacterium]
SQRKRWIQAELALHYDKDGHDLDISEVIELLEGVRGLAVSGASVYGIEMPIDTRVELKPGSFEVIIQLVSPEDVAKAMGTLIAMTTADRLDALNRVRGFVEDMLTYAKRFGGKVVAQEHVHLHEEEVEIREGDAPPVFIKKRVYDHTLKGPSVFVDASKVARPVADGDAKTLDVRSGAKEISFTKDEADRLLADTTPPAALPEPEITREQQRTEREVFTIRSPGLDAQLQWHLRDRMGTNYRMPLRDEEFRRKMDNNEVLFGVGDELDADILITEQLDKTGEVVGQPHRAIIRVHEKPAA